jgi:cryptochrome
VSPHLRTNYFVLTFLLLDFRVYSPVTYRKKFDPTGALRQFVPELSQFEDKYVYEPWKALVTGLKRVGCVIGKEYPKVN